MGDYTLTRRDYTNLKSRLTRAINRGDQQKIIDECNHAERIFEEKGYPDNWMRWQRAKEDAEYQIRLDRSKSPWI